MVRGPVKKKHLKSVFTSIVNSFVYGNNTVKLGDWFNFKKQNTTEIKEIQRLQNEIKEIEEDNEYLKDDMPRTALFTKLLQNQDLI